MWYWIVAVVTLVIGIIRIGFKWGKWKEDKYGFEDMAGMNIVVTVFASAAWPGTWAIVAMVYVTLALWKFGGFIHRYTNIMKARARSNQVRVKVGNGSSFVLKDPKPLDSVILLLDPTGERGMNRMDVIRNALNLYTTITKYTQDGSKLMVGKSKEDLKIQIEVPGVRNSNAA